MIRMITKKEFGNIKANVYIKDYKVIERDKDYIYIKYLDSNIYTLVGKYIIYCKDEDDISKNVLYYYSNVHLLNFLIKNKSLVCQKKLF